LLPSLIPALHWAGQVYKDEPVVGRVLEVLTTPSGTAESRDIHHTILTMCAPTLNLAMRSTASKEAGPTSVVKALSNLEHFTLFSERQVQNDGPGAVSILQHSLLSIITTPDGEQSTSDIPSLVTYVVEVQGPEATLRILIGVLLQLSDSHHFLFALDAITTIISTVGTEVRDALRVHYNNLGPLLKTGETLHAEAVVRLYRQVEAYSNLLTVQEMTLDTFNFAQQLTNIDTADPNLDGVTAVPGLMDMNADQDQADGIDQVLDEVAALGNMDANDAGLSFDDMYGLQGNDMDLNDLDLDMF